MQTHSPLTVTAIVSRTSQVIDAEVDGEVVALNIDHGACYGLNSVGSRIWKMLEAPARIGDICATLRAEYAVDQEACERDVIELLENLRSEGLIAEFEAAPAAAG